MGEYNTQKIDIRLEAYACILLGCYYNRHSDLLEDRHTDDVIIKKIPSVFLLMEKF